MGRGPTLTPEANPWAFPDGIDDVVGGYTLIYGLTCPITKDVRYVGQTTKPRLRFLEHCLINIKTPLSLWVQDLRSHGLRPGAVELCRVPDGEDVGECEMLMLAIHDREGLLLNVARYGIAAVCVPKKQDPKRWAGKRIDYRGESLTISELAARLGCMPAALGKRIAAYGIEGAIAETVRCYGT